MIWILFVILAVPGSQNFSNQVPLGSREECSVARDQLRATQAIVEGNLDGRPFPHIAAICIPKEGTGGFNQTRR